MRCELAGLVIALAAGSVGCAGDMRLPDAGAPLDANLDAGAADTGPTDGGASEEQRFLTRLSSASDLAEVSSATAAGVKYLFNVADAPRTPPLTEDCYFQNMRLFDWHLFFLQSFEEFEGLAFDSYVSLVLRRATRRWWGGAIEVSLGARHPDSGTLGVVGYRVYGEPGQLDVNEIVEVDRIAKGCMPFVAPHLVFLPEGAEQRALAEQSAAFLSDNDVSWTVEPLSARLSHTRYSSGEGYGTLRIVPAGQPVGSYGPRDVVVVQTAPEVIEQVQGLITQDAQTATSAANLSLITRGTPNAALPRIYDAALFATFEGELIHIVVDEAGVVLEPARRVDAEAFWAQ